MAFQQQQQRPQAPRQLSVPQTIPEAAAVNSQRKRAIEESQEWILFSPVQDDEASVTATHTSQTPRTATHLSDFGSLETHIRSQPQNSNDSSGIHIDDLTDEGDDYDAEELDSLDDGLHAFHHPFSVSTPPHLDTSGGTVLPTHDGFGTFPSGAGLQEQLWQFERHNPQRRTGRSGRRNSARRTADNAEEEPRLELGVDAEDDRTARIEQWRLDQSRALLEEIERETRRMRRRATRMGSAASSKELRTLDAISKALETREASSTSAAPSPPSESFWRRITRRVIRDLIGLDESTLSVLFGETFVQGEADGSSKLRDGQDDDKAGRTPTQSSPLADANVANRDTQSWELRLLETIARELGTLVNRFSEHSNDGAFTTYKRMQSMPIEYAGMPVPRAPSMRSRRINELEASRGASDPLFAPTVPQVVLTPTTEHGDSSLWGIEEEPAALDAETREREYWEQEVDIKMVFNYLKNRFSIQSSSPPPSRAPSKAPPPPPTAGPLPASWATNASGLVTTPESLRRAEIIRRHHPLVSRAAKRDSILRRHHALQRRAVIGGGITAGAGGSSSCASQSTKRSRTGSSRHYWGSASGRGSGGALGGWGEV